MALGSWTADLDYSHSAKNDLLNEDGNPRKLWMLVWDSNDLLVYPPLPLLWAKPSKKRIEIGGTSILWDLGIEGVGPTIRDREYLSGAEKLDNPTFLLDPPDSYWRRAAENSRWVITTGLASNIGGYDGDDVMESERKFPTRPGHSYQAIVSGVSGLTRLKARIVFEGRFSPQNLWPNGDLSGGSAGWTAGTYSSIVLDPANAYDPAVSEYVMRCGPIPRPILNSDPGLETGTGWSDVLSPSPMSDDIDIINDPANAYSGNNVMRVGPITQHQVFQNADFGDGHDFWFPSSTDAEPHFVWEVDPTEGVNGTSCLRTTGYATAGRPGPETIKYLRATMGGTGVIPYDVNPGENFTAEAYFKAAPGTEGQALISIMIPHPSVPGHDIWEHSSQNLEGVDMANMQWTRATIENLTIPENRFVLNALVEVRNHGLGYWYVDHYTLTRTRGNRARIVSDTAYAIDTDARYEIAGMVRTDGAMTGSLSVGVILEGAGMTDQTEGEDKTSTDYVWDRAAKEFRPPTGYTHARLSVSGRDILGAPAWVDQITLTKMDNNRDSMTATGIPVIPERSYKAKVKVRFDPFVQRGTVRLEMRFLRLGYPDLTRDSPTMENTEGEWKELEFDVTPPSGFGEVVARVVFTDIDGGFVYASHFSLVDNDSGTVVYDSYSAIDPIGINFFVNADAPEGAEFVWVDVIAEQGSGPWTVEGVSLKRTDGPTATGDDIIADLLVHPTTGLPMGISPGVINCPETIPFDWRQVNMTVLAALAHYVDVISEPVREFRINPAIPPTIDISTSPFVVRPIVLMPTDIDVEEVSDPTTDVTKRATEIEVFGAEVHTLSGQSKLITATATVPGEVEYDINNRPIVRTRPISDGTIDTFGYAQAYAADQALREAHPGLVVDVALTGTPYQRGAMDVGDWLEVFKPESGIQDLTNPKTVEGVPAFPKVLRAVAREREHGPQFRVEMLRPDGTTFPLAVNHSERDTTKLTLAERRLFDWEADPQGGATGSQYLRDRSSKPR